MNVIIFCALIWGICKLIGTASRRAKENARQREMERIKAEQARQRLEQQRQREAIREREREAKEQARKQVEHDKAIAKAAKERETMRKEQERQAAAIARHEQELMKIDNRLSAIEGEISHNREMVDRIAKLIELEEEEQSKCTKDSAEWAKHEKKIISLTNQQYNAQKKINKAKADKRICEQKLA